ncbi:MAG: thioredoxin [Crocinitomicaceae bacterium]|jgi:thioredoxin 1|nr:thioredoxin [Crocinitomicaceae bacterium]MDP4760042.1 thioredoxin [Crocinitomicaceae bacterium]
MGKFNDIIQSNTPTLVDFYATWCGPCKMMHPVLEDLKKQMGSKIRILKIDVDKNQDIAALYKVRGVPTFVLFKKGEKLWRESGAFPLSTLKAKIQAVL